MKRLFSTAPPLLSPGKIGDLGLRNRVVMCALTRQRCARSGPDNGVPNDMLVQYYEKRADDAGLILTECSATAE
jgi:2,4-dienoyl-CoA reductase-like NADH-dependent reductase (Old Yellow Enzyme family)